MTAIQVGHERVYDDFTAATLDPERWTILTAKGPDGSLHPYADRNAAVVTGDGEVAITVNPFTRFHDTDPLRNNAKQMYRSTERIDVPPSGDLVVETDMAVRTYGQIPYDLLDAFGTMNLFDLSTGVVLDTAATGDTVYAVVERLVIKGVTEPADHYRHRVVLDVPTEPGQWHHYAISYDARTSRASWHVDGVRHYWATVPVPVRGFHLGMALFSARDLTRHGRAEREHGQGATGRWGPWRVTTSG